MEILSFIIIKICTEFRHLVNGACSDSWLAQLTFPVPYMAWYAFYLNQFISRPPIGGRPNYASDARITPWKRINYIVNLPLHIFRRNL